MYFLRAFARLRPPRNYRVLCAKIVSAVLLAPAAFAQEATTDPFTDTRDGGKLHAASGFVCPAKIGAFERDAVGVADIATGADLCSYSALNGVYGSITLVPLHGPYNAQASLAPSFSEQEGVGAKRVADGMATLSAKPEPVVIYARTYETDRLEDQSYRLVFTGAQFGNWAVETTIEYADPRDTAIEDEFLHAAYTAARSEIAAK
jgi:hypothetical protein